MTPEQIELVRQSFGTLLPVADDAGDVFFRRLFDIAPEVRPLFPDDMKMQAHKFMAAMLFIVRGLDAYDDIAPNLGDLARRHVAFGVNDTHYPVFREALMWMLEQGLADEWTPEVAEAWRLAYHRVARTMITAARVARAATATN
ncbi:MAG: hemin receptor [Chloroflexaceae bacterium]|nr:hemin receptor [Chloroflexaceae bacterium]NJO04655.1 hemin receptor [Chloroflexaceae bacterium]